MEKIIFRETRLSEPGGPVTAWSPHEWRQILQSGQPSNFNLRINFTLRNSFFPTTECCGAGAEIIWGPGAGAEAENKLK